MDEVIFRCDSSGEVKYSFLSEDKTLVTGHWRSEKGDPDSVVIKKTRERTDGTVFRGTSLFGTKTTTDYHNKFKITFKSMRRVK